MVTGTKLSSIAKLIKTVKFQYLMLVVNFRILKRKALIIIQEHALAKTGLDYSQYNFTQSHLASIDTC